MKPDSLPFVLLVIAALDARSATVIEFASTNVLSDEFAGAAKVSIVRQGSTAAIDVVTVSTADGTAIVGEDYEALSTQLTFAAGETNKAVEIPLKDDYFAEPDKTFLVRITDLPTGASSGKSVASVLVRDDDRPGSIDPSWSSPLGLPPLGPNEVRYADPHIILQQPDGKLIVDVWVWDSDFLYPLYWHLLRINPDGSVDPTYPIRDSFPSTAGGNLLDRRIAVMPDGTLLVWDSESTATTFLGYHLRYRLNSDGSQDETFPSLSSKSGGSFELIPQPDGKILLNDPSSLILLNGQRMPWLFRLNNDGSLDTAFNAPTNISGFIRLHSDGQVFVETYTTPKKLYRLHNDGSRDASFIPPANLSLSVLKLLPDGKIFATASVSPQSQKLYRLNQDGSMDSGFSVGTIVGPQPTGLWNVLSQADGKFVFSGIFQTFNGQVLNSIVRLNPDGSVDSSFQTGLGFQGAVSPNDPAQVLDPLTPFPGGRILVSGYYEKFNGQKVTPPIILNPDGTRDPSFEGTLTDAIGYVSQVILVRARDGTLYQSADRTLYFANGYGMGRLRTDLPLRLIATGRDSGSATRLTANALAGRSYTLQASEDLANWSNLTTQSATTNRLDFTDAPAPPAKRFYRVRGN